MEFSWLAQKKEQDFQFKLFFFFKVANLDDTF
jgi:hypothetical protein